MVDLEEEIIDKDWLQPNRIFNKNSLLGDDETNDEARLMSRDVLPRPKALLAKKFREVLDYHNKMAAEIDKVESGEDSTLRKLSDLSKYSYASVCSIILSNLFETSADR